MGSIILNVVLLLNLRVVAYITTNKSKLGTLPNAYCLIGHVPRVLLFTIPAWKKITLSDIDSRVFSRSFWDCPKNTRANMSSEYERSVPCS